MHIIFRYPKLSETLKRCPRNFSTLWDQNFLTEKCDTTPPLFIHKIFRNQKFSQKKQDYLTKFSGTVKHKNFDWKSWYPPLLIHKIIFPTRNFLKHRMLPWRSFFGPVRWKKFDKTVKLPPSFAWKFSIPEFFRNTEVFSRILSAPCQKFFNGV